MKNHSKIGHPLLIISILLLICNDWLWKAEFHNHLTGKLSDFAGLFAFPFLMSVLFPKHSLKIAFATAIFFVFWKSPYAQYMIDSINQVGIPLQRTVDFSDNIALLSVVLSFFIFKISKTYHVHLVLQKAIMLIAGLAFMATSFPRGEYQKFVNINKAYQFDCSKGELVSRLNMLQLKEIKKINGYGRRIDFNSKTNVFHFQGEVDTLALILDYNKLKDQDTIVFSSKFAEIQIMGDDKKSTLTLLSAYKYVARYKDRDYKEKAIKTFEKQIVKKLRKRG